ncbi:NDX1 [Scenedesmus sp. PABB004]|nr:NDX1 [Scenedesmus sp. PABB004]
MGYAAAPWTFTGRALYQLSLVKADEARKYVPPELKLVEFFGYTLGGVYLARYDGSPAGSFDECVAMAGLVWNPPTSCAWAARVYVSNGEARDHGVRSVGLPSRLAAFEPLRHAASSSKAWWTRGGSKESGRERSSSSSSSRSGSGSRESSSGGSGGSGGRESSSSGRGGGGEEVALINVDRGRRGLPHRPVAVFQLPALPAGGFLGPRLRLSLPSFSGGTAEHPGLLQYSCDLATRVMPVAPMRVLLPDSHEAAGSGGRGGRGAAPAAAAAGRAPHPEVLDLLLNGWPLACLAFSDMVMRVEEPTRLTLPAPSEKQHALPALAAVLPQKR